MSQLILSRGQRGLLSRVMIMQKQNKTKNNIKSLNKEIFRVFAECFVLCNDAVYQSAHTHPHGTFAIQSLTNQLSFMIDYNNELVSSRHNTHK